MEYVKIGGRVWDIKILNLTENFEIVESENTGATLAPGHPTCLDVVGTNISHTLTVARNGDNYAEYDEFFDYVSLPRNYGVDVEIVHNQSVIKYEARFTSGQRACAKIDKKNGKVFWGEFSVDIVPMKAQVLPDE